MFWSVPVADIETPDVLPTIKSVTKLADVCTLPVTVKELKVPTLVTFGCAAVVNVPATVVNEPSVAEMLPALALPVTDKLVSVPTLVILG